MKKLPTTVIAVTTLVVATACGAGPATLNPGSPSGTPPVATIAPTHMDQSPTAAASGKDGAAKDNAAGPVECKYENYGKINKPVDPPKGKDVATTGTLTANLKLASGTIPVTLDRSWAPCTVNSFEALAQQKYFDGITCHRLTSSGIFVLQCGDPTGSGTGGPGYRFADELDGARKLSPAGGKAVNYAAGTLAMANAGPDTNGSQFFIVYQDSPLPPNYAVFGKTTPEGIGIVVKLAEQGTKMGSETPIGNTKIESVTLG